MRSLLTFCVFCLIMSSAFGQLKQVHRYEKEKNFSDDNFLVTPLADAGVLLFRENNKALKSKDNVWEMIKLDSALNEAWNRTIEVDYKYSILGFEYREGYLYMLFYDFKGSKTSYSILKVETDTGSEERFEITSELGMEPTHLLINENQMVLGGDINYRSTFVIFDYKSDQLKVVPGFFHRKSEILDFNYDAQHGTYNVLLAEKNASGLNQLDIRSFDGNGEMIVEETYSLKDNYRTLNGKIIIGDNNHLYFTGAYAENNSYYSQGVFFGDIAPGKAPALKYNPLAELQHVFDYMGEKRAEKAREKVRLSATGKEYEFKTQMLIQEFKSTDDQFVLVTDIYKPNYVMGQNAMMNDESANSGYSNHTNQKYVKKTSGSSNVGQASSVEFYQAMLMVMDQNGNLIWDNSLPTPDVETLGLDRIAAAHVSTAKSCLLYKDEHDLRFKLFDKEKDIVSDTTIAINTFAEHDKIIRATDNQGKVEHWYDNSFIVWGYHRIQNNVSNESNKSRNVFYINKITVD